MDAERLAPDEIRHRPAARQAMRDILERVRRAPAAPVTQLAKRMGLTG